MIPKQLQKEGFRFCLIPKQSKAPFEQKWQTENNYSFDDDVLIKHLDNGNNYGVIGGYNKLIILDFDDKEIEKKIIPLLPETLTIETGSGGTHLYFLIDDSPSLKILNENKDTLIDVQGRGKQVVGAGSKHPNGNDYKVVKDIPLSKILLKNLKIILSSYLKEKDKFKEEYDSDNMVQMIKDRLPIDSVLSNYNYDLSRNPTKCQLGHTSKSGTCFSYTNGENVWYCHHCGEGGDIFSLVKAHESCDFPTAKEILRKMAGIEKLTNTSKSCSTLTISELREQIFEIIYDDKIKNKDDKISEKIVNFISANKKIKTIRSDEKAEVWIYDNGIYISEGRTYIKEFVRKILGYTYKQSKINNIITKIEADTYISSDEFFIEEDVNLIAIENGILNLKTKELMKYSSKYKFFNKIPVKYNPAKNCNNFINFLKGILRDSSDIETLQEMFGFLLYRTYEVEKAIMFNGGGRNGKSKTIEIMKKFIGVKNCANVPIQSLEKDQFAMGELFNKLANLSADISKTALEETGRFKSLIGRDLISAPRKFLSMVHFQNYAKMIFSANTLPVTHDLTEAFWNRWVIIDFPFTFLSKKEYDLQSDKENLKIANPNIVKDIISESEMSGILNWALEGLDRLLATGDFSSNRSNNEVKNIWLRRSSSIHAFIMDCVKRKSDSKVPKQEFIEAYLDYCSKHKISSVTEKIIKNTLETTVGSTDYRPMIGEERVVCWKGIILK